MLRFFKIFSSVHKLVDDSIKEQSEDKNNKLSDEDYIIFNNLNFSNLKYEEIEFLIDNYKKISGKQIFGQMIKENGYPIILRCGHNGIYNRNEQSSLNAILNKIKFV